MVVSSADTSSSISFLIFAIAETMVCSLIFSSSCLVAYMLFAIFSLHANKNLPLDIVAPP